MELLRMAHGGAMFYGSASTLERIVAEDIWESLLAVKFGGPLRSRLNNRKIAETLFKAVIYNAERANYLSWSNP
jgi:hypothetical protein